MIFFEQEAVDAFGDLEVLAVWERNSPPNLVEGIRYYSPLNATLVIETTRNRDAHVRFRVYPRVGEPVIYTNELIGNVSNKEEITTFPVRRGQVFSLEFHWIMSVNRYNWIPFS